MNLITFLTITTLTSVSLSQFILKKDHKNSKKYSTFLYPETQSVQNNGKSYKIVYIEPKQENFICPDQREACGMDYRTYKDRCSMPQGVEIFKMGRCPYNSQNYRRERRERTNDVIFYEPNEEGYRTGYFNDGNGRRFRNY